MDFLTHPQNMMFFIGYCVIAIFLFLEVIGIIIGFSLMSVMDDFADFELETGSSAGISGLVSWFNLHKVPFMIWLCLFLFFFSTTGYLTNNFASQLTGYVVPTFFSIPFSVFIGLIGAKSLSTGIAKFIPKNESYHIDEDDFAEYTAIVTTGTARQDLAARAAFTDKFNTRHSILVKPLPESPDIQEGEQVVLVKKEGKAWLVTPLLSSE